MVRIKHRYLLLNILFPSLENAHIKSAKSDDAVSNNDFLRFHAPSPPHLTAQLLLRQIRDSIQLNFGDYGAGIVASSLKCVYFSPATSTAIIRCPRAQFRLVWAALTFLSVLPAATRGGPAVQCVVRVVRVSGTIRKAEEAAIRRARMDIVRLKAIEARGQGVPKALESFLAASDPKPTSANGSSSLRQEDEGVIDLDDGDEDMDEDDSE